MNRQHIRHTLIPAAHLFLIQGEKILLSRRCATGYEDGNYSVPAGHVEKNERIVDAMIREVKEEIGITLLEADLRLVHIMHRKKNGEDRIDFFYTTNDWHGNIVNVEPLKCDELTWYSFDTLPLNMVDYVASALQSVRRSESFSYFGW